MLLNDLDTTLRAAGLTVTEVAGWQGHNHGPLTAVNCVVIHHTAGAAAGDYPSAGIVRNGRPDLDGPLAQLGVGRSGRVYIFSNGVSWHAGATLQTWQDNFHAIGIEVESTGTGVEWPLVQVHAAAKAAAALCRRYGVASGRVLGHKEICSPPGRKVDPIGITGDMRGFRSLVQYYINNPDGDDVEAVDVWGYKNVKVDARDAFGLLKSAVDVATNNQTRINTVTAAVDTLEPKVGALQTGLTSARGEVAALTNKVDALIALVSAGGGGGVVDVTALAKAVNDDAARRLAE